MEDIRYHKLFKICWRASLVCYLLSFIPPVYSTSISSLPLCQGLMMLVWGWIPIGFQFLVWLGNPIFLFVRARVRMKTDCNGHYTSSKKLRSFVYATVILGIMFYFKGEVIEDEGGCLHKIESFHLGYWLWEASFILLAVALMAKSEIESNAHWLIGRCIRIGSILRKKVE